MSAKANKCLLGLSKIKKYQHIAPMAVSGAKKVTFILLFKMPTVYFTAFSFNWNYIFALDG